MRRLGGKREKRKKSERKRKKRERERERRKESIDGRAGWRMQMMRCSGDAANAETVLWL